MGLLNFIQNTESARSVFGKRELKIIEKQLLGINLTQSEKNRLSRDIRKKLEFIAEVSKFRNEFKLKKGAMVKAIIETTKEAILEDINVRHIKRIVLYGSVVENKITFKSDIDIAVEFDKITLENATIFRKRIFGKIPDRVDIQVVNILPEKIKKEIKMKGKLIYCK